MRLEKSPTITSIALRGHRCRRIFTHLEQLGNLLETELHFLRPPDKLQTRDVTLKVNTDPGTRNDD